MQDVSIFRLHTLRLCYLILAVGLGLYILPSVIHHTADSAIAHGIQQSLLAVLASRLCSDYAIPYRCSRCCSSS
jgi:hypothetical protein